MQVAATNRDWGRRACFRVGFVWQTGFGFRIGFDGPNEPEAFDNFFSGSLVLCCKFTIRCANCIREFSEAIWLSNWVRLVISILVFTEQFWVRSIILVDGVYCEIGFD
jgi:hypothetical protein